MFIISAASLAVGVAKRGGPAPPLDTCLIATDRLSLSLSLSLSLYLCECVCVFESEIQQHQTEMNREKWRTAQQLHTPSDSEYKHTHNTH